MKFLRVKLFVFFAFLLTSNAWGATQLQLTPSSISMAAGTTDKISWVGSGATSSYIMSFPSGRQSWMTASFNSGNKSGFIDLKPPLNINGSFSASFKICDSSQASDCDTRNFIVTVSQQVQPLSISISNISIGSGESFNHPFLISGGISPYYATIISGQFSNGDKPFPNATDRRLYCINPETCRTPNGPESVQFQVRVTDDDGTTATDSFTVSVGAPLQTHNLRVIRNGEGSCIVTSSPSGINCGTDCDHDYDENTVVTLTGSGANFSGWGSICAGTSPCTVTMNTEKDVIAECPNQVVATPPLFQSGHVSPSSGTISSPFSFVSNWTDPEGEYIINARVRYRKQGTTSWTIVSMPHVFDTNAQFTKELLLPTTGTFEYQFIADSSIVLANTGISASWTPTKIFTVTNAVTQRLLTVSKSGSGRVISTPSGIDCSGTSGCQSSFNDGSTVSLSASGSSGYQFSNWSEDCAGNTCSLVMNSNKSVQAHFSSVPVGNNKPRLVTSSPATSVQVGNTVTLGFIGRDQDGDLSHIEVDWEGNGNPVRLDNVQDGIQYLFSITPTTVHHMQWSATAYDNNGNYSLPVGGSISVTPIPSDVEPPLSGYPASNEVATNDLSLNAKKCYSCPCESSVLKDKPVDLATGAQVESRTLLRVAGLLPIDFTINYNSLVLDVGLVGRGWQFSYGYAAQIVEKENGDLIVYWSKNRFNNFTKNGDTYTSSEFGSRFDLITKQADNTFRIKRQNRLTYIFDGDNRLNVIENHKGQKLEYTFDIQNKLRKITDPISGIFLSYSYNSEGLLQTVSDPLNNQVQLEYQDKNLTRVIRADGTTDDYTYNDLGQIITRTLGGVLIESNTHDNSGRTITQDDAKTSNLLAKFSYQPQASQINSTYTDKNGHHTDYIHSTDYQLNKSTDALGNINTFTYDANGKRKTATDAKGNTTNFTHDNNGDLILTIFADGTRETRAYDANRNLKSITDQANNTESYTYDASHNLIRYINKEGDATDYTYNPQGQLLSETSPEGNTTAYTYLNGKLASITNPKSDTKTYTYDLAGRLIGETDFAGNATVYQLDPVGRKTKETDALQQTQHWTYNARGQVLTYTDAKNNLTQYEYDGEGNLIKKILPDSSEWQYGYDGENREISTTNPRGHTTTYGRDVLGRIVRTTDAKGNIYTTQYDPNGNIISTQSPLGGSTTTVYDSLNRPTEIKDALGNAISYIYDDRSNITESTDKEGKKTNLEHDKLDQTTTITDPDIKVSSQTFDKDKNTKQVTDPNNNARVLTRDENGRITSEQTADGISIQYEYDPRGLVTKKTNGRNQDTTYIYDAIGQLESTTDPVGTSTYTYDKNSNLLTISENDIVATRTYDNRDRVTTYKPNGSNETIGYVYDASSNLNTLQYPAISGAGNIPVNYSYDELDQLTTVSGMGISSTYELDAKGRTTKITRGNGTIETRRYDVADRITQIKDIKADGSLIIQYDYRYDKTGKLIGTKVNPTLPSPPMNLLRDMSMSYASPNRILSRDFTKNPPIHDNIFDRDDDGNILSLEGNELRLSQKPHTKSTTGGVVFPVIEPVAHNVLESNVRNQLIKAGDYSYQYHPEGYRTALIHTQGGTTSTTRYLVNPEADLSQLLREKLPNGDSRDYVYANGLIAQKNSSGGIYYFHYDYRGSVVAVTDNSGAIVARFGYLPYGQRYIISGAFDTAFGYNGRDGVITDPNQLIYMRARYYSPDQKRFLSKDPLRGEIGDLGTLNRYAYVGGDPVNAVDPSGLTAVFDRRYDDGYWTSDQSTNSCSIYRAPNVPINQPLPYLPTGNTCDGDKRPQLCKVGVGLAKTPDYIPFRKGTRPTQSRFSYYHPKPYSPQTPQNRPASRLELNNDLLEKGFRAPSTSPRGYVTYKHPNGTRVDIKPNGEVISTQRKWKADGSGKYTERQDFEGKRLPNQSHSTNYFVQ